MDIQKWTWRIVNGAFCVLTLLMVFSFCVGGFTLHVAECSIRFHRLDHLFYLVIFLSGLKLFFDPSWRQIRRYFLSLDCCFYWVLFCFGTGSFALFLWGFNDISGITDLLATGNLTHKQWEDGLRQYLQFFFVLFHVLWIVFSRWVSRPAPERMIEVMKKDAQILSLAGLAFFPFILIFGMGVEDNEWYFFLTVSLPSIVIGLKTALWAKCRSGGTGLEKIPYRAVLFSLITVYVGIFSFLSIRKLDLYLGNGDFPVYLQPLWNTLHHRFMQINWYYTSPGVSMDWFGEHLDLVYLLLLPLYWISSDPRTFVFLQALLIGLAAWPLFEIAKMKLKSAPLALALAWAYLVHPMISRGLLFDFHAESAEPLLIFTTFLFLEKKKLIPFLLSALLLIFCKEDASLYLIVFGIYVFWIKKERKMGFACACVGVLWLLLAIGFVIPLFRGANFYHSVGDRYGWMGKDFKEVGTFILKHPGQVLAYFFNQQSMKNFAYLLIPLGLLPLFHWVSCVLVLPSTLELFLSSFTKMKRLLLHYPWFISPFYFLGAVLGLEVLLKRRICRSSSFQWGLIAYLFCSGLIFHYEFDPQPSGSGTYNWYYNSPAPFGKYFDLNYYAMNDHDRAAKKFIRERIPQEEPLSTCHRFSHDLCRRSVLRMFPDETADVKLIFLDIFWTQYVPLTVRDLRRRKRAVFECLEKGAFGVRDYEDGYLLLERGYSRDHNLEVAQDLVCFFEAEVSAGRVGKTVVDSQAYNKTARLISKGVFLSGVGLISDDMDIPKGPLQVSLRMRADGFVKNGVVCKIQLIQESSGQVLLEKSMEEKDFSKTLQYQDVVLQWENPAKQTLVITVSYEGHADLWIDHLRWLSPSLSWDDLRKNLNL